GTPPVDTSNQARRTLAEGPHNQVPNPAQARSMASPTHQAAPGPWKPHESGSDVENRTASKPSRGAADNTAGLQRQVAASPSRAYGVTPPVGGLPKSGRNSPPSASHAFTQQTKVNRVNIRFNGPAVGTSPHFLEYAADLPKNKVEGADFL